MAPTTLPTILTNTLAGTLDPSGITIIGGRTVTRGADNGAGFPILFAPLGSAGSSVPDTPAELRAAITALTTATPIVLIGDDQVTGTPVDSWADATAGATFSTTGTARPTVTANKFGTRSGIVFDGVDDELSSGALSAYDNNSTITAIVFAELTSNSATQILLRSAYAGATVNNDRLFSLFRSGSAGLLAGASRDTAGTSITALGSAFANTDPARNIAIALRWSADDSITFLSDGSTVSTTGADNPTDTHTRFRIAADSDADLGTYAQATYGVVVIIPEDVGASNLSQMMSLINNYLGGGFTI